MLAKVGGSCRGSLFELLIASPSGMPCAASGGQVGTIAEIREYYHSVSRNCYVLVVIPITRKLLTSLVIL